MYSELVEKYTLDIYKITRLYNNGELDDENYYNEISYLLEEFERKVKEELNGSTS